MEELNASDRWTKSLRAVVAAAAHEAATLLTQPERQIGTYHLLLGILAHGESRSAHFLIAAGATYQTLRRTIIASLESPGSTYGNASDAAIGSVEVTVEIEVDPVTKGQGGQAFRRPTIPPYTPAVESAFAKAATMADGPIDAQHLLLAILDMEMLGTQVLEASTGKSLAEVRRRARQYLG